MIRRLFSALFTVQLALLSIICLALITLLVYYVVTGDPTWKIYGLVLGFCLAVGGIWYLLTAEIVGAGGLGEDAVQSHLPVLTESYSRALCRKLPALEPIRRFFQWFWRVSGLDDVNSPLWLTPFGGWFTVFLSLPLLISSLVMFIRTELFLHRSISAEGNVIRLVADRDETVHYAPVFTYTAHDGQTFAVQSNTYSAPSEFRVGQKVPVLYEKDHPEQARIATHQQVHSLELVFGSVGLFFAGIGFGSLLYQRKRNRRAPKLFVAT